MAVAFLNDYAAISEAIENAGRVTASSEFGRRYHGFAQTLFGPDDMPARRPARRFLEFFRVSSTHSEG